MAVLSLDSVDWYAVSVGGVLVLLLLGWFSRLAAPHYPHFRAWTLNHIFYPLPGPWKWVRIFFVSFDSLRVTYVDAVALVVYIIVNGVCIGVNLHKEALRSDLMFRSGILALINMMCLFLGRRTSIVANGLIPLHKYYLIHHWIGRMVVVQALLHTGLAIDPRTWVLDRVTISGVTAASALAMILFSSLWFIRGVFFEIFLITHLLLALTTIGALLWHILPRTYVFAFPVISIFVWSITILQQLAYRNRGAYISKYTIFPQQGLLGQPRTIRLNICVENHIDFEPGHYFYLRFRGLRRRYRHQAHPFMIAWHEYSKEPQGNKKVDITTLTVLIQPQKGLTARLGRELDRLSSAGSSFRSSLVLGGPYGQRLHVEQYHTVMLVARGIGIAGVLSYAQRLAQRLQLDATKKVDILWELDHNSQEKWIPDHLRTLQDQDPGRRTNLIYCYYPEKRISPPLMKLDEGWKCIYPGDAELTLDDVIEQEACRSRRSIVVTCGGTRFTQKIRKKVLSISRDNIIEFAEVEFRPQNIGEEDDNGQLMHRRPRVARNVLRKRPNIRHVHAEEIELASFPAQDSGIALPGPHAMPYQNDHIGNATRVEPTDFV